MQPNYACLLFICFYVPLIIAQYGQNDIVKIKIENKIVVVTLKFLIGSIVLVGSLEFSTISGYRIAKPGGLI